ncbi:polymerase III polypeptide H [Thelephora ganbajun]|uniref:Polymerase III polypeptide H n=1 Tax=Thelephora ganbajun TaxID=370292 RepID=A0ACB6ZGE5_THEGA|nr:polymerase III polypeptide H [Thelephora ganbajun]
MFVLSIIKDTIAVKPHQFGIPAAQALINEINTIYANKVLHDVGLCIAVFDLAEVGEGKVRYGDGCLWYKLTFRMVIFRPFVSEVILAKVKSSDEDGIRLSVGFFDDMYIPLTYLPEPSAFDPNERAYFWLPSAADSGTKPTVHDMLDSQTTERMYIDAGEIVRVRVESDEFYDHEPGPPPKALEGVLVLREQKKAPYTIVCSIAEQGLGPVSWWKNAEIETMDQN